jgi:predicted metal-dependent phosphoesterase TrpH
VIDLHTHSTASDGTDSPEELVALALAAGVDTLALTDHDTTGGWERAATAVSELTAPFTLVRGTEFSCFHAAGNGRTIGLHLLGYLFDPEAAELKQERAALRDDRLDRGERLVANLAVDYPISWQQVIDIAGDGSVGRPHIGRALVEAGVVSTVSEAFAGPLSSAAPYYVAKRDMPVLAAIGMIRRAGGVPVIAHAWARTRGQILDERVIGELVDHGLLGIEADHSDHTAPDAARLRDVARRLGVLYTGSSDYHGTNKAVRLGAAQTQPEQFQRLAAAASGAELIHSPAR